MATFNQVHLSNGLLEGTIVDDGSYKYVAYYGIPYATITSRFQDAKPDTRQWEGVKKANKKDIVCTQRQRETHLIIGQEDCLILNVYVPSSPTASLRPVMVFIHGGGFKDGSAHTYEPDNLMKYNVVLVTVNYRLDILGFLCLGIKEAPGNVGLKDQALALKWINKNIKTFGGDPKTVTLFGQSAGAASVSYHLLSPMTTGLFHRAIIQSGTALSYWAFQFDPINIAHKFSKQLGPKIDSLKELVTILRNKTDKELLMMTIPRKHGDEVESEDIFVPCMEKNTLDNIRFLTDYPYNLISRGKYNKMPIIIGFNDEEGYYFAGLENDTTIQQINFLDALPRNLKFPSPKKKKQVADTIKTLYLRNHRISRNNLVIFSKYEGECGIIFPIAITIEMLLATSSTPVYAYKFKYDSELNEAKAVSGFKKYPGATHGDELFYLFSEDKVESVFLSVQDKTFIRKFTTLWTNFAKFGDPTPEVSKLLPLKWARANKGDVRVYVIDHEMSTEPLWNSKRLLYWNVTYSKFRRRK